MIVPRTTSILLVVLVSLTLLNFILKYYTYFVLVVASHHDKSEEPPHPHELYVPLLTYIPTRSPVFTRPWVLVTNSFIEDSFTGLVATLMILFYLGKYLETIWGSREFVKFICAIVLGSNISLYLFYSVRAALGSPAVPPVIISSMAITSGLFVAIKQRISNHYLLFFKGNLRVKITYVPFVLLVVLGVVALVFPQYVISFHLAFLGFVISWVYLRFFKEGTNERQSYLLPFALRKRNKTKATMLLDSTPSKGDRSDLFALSTFFPAPLSLLVRFASEAVFSLLVKYGLLNRKDFVSDSMVSEFEDIDELQTNLFGLSPLTGAQDISAIPGASSKLKSVWSWFAGPPKPVRPSVEKRRKLALKEFE